MRRRRQKKKKRGLWRDRHRWIALEVAQVEEGSLLQPHLEQARGHLHTKRSSRRAWARESSAEQERRGVGTRLGLRERRSLRILVE
jgi:hypothetical protein